MPVLVWSTGYKFLGANIQPLLAQPTVFGFPNNPAGVPNRDFTVNVGTLVGSIFAWDLGNGFGVSYLAAVHLNDLDAGRGLPQFSSNTYRQGFAASYTADGWNLTANLTHNFYDSPAGSRVPSDGRLVRSTSRTPSCSTSRRPRSSASSRSARWHTG